MTYNSHGFHIPGSPTADEFDEQGNPIRPIRMRCGGTHLCRTCKAEAEAYWNRNKEEEIVTDRYSTRVEQVEAKQLTKDNAEEIAAWTGGQLIEEAKPSDPTDVYIAVMLPSVGASTPVVTVGGWAVKDLKTGRYSAMTDQNFKARYQYLGTGDSGAREYTGRELLREKLQNDPSTYPNPQRGLDTYRRSADTDGVIRRSTARQI